MLNREIDDPKVRSSLVNPRERSLLYIACASLFTMGALIALVYWPDSIAPPVLAAALIGFAWAIATDSVLILKRSLVLGALASVLYLSYTGNAERPMEGVVFLSSLIMAVGAVGVIEKQEWGRIALEGAAAGWAALIVNNCAAFLQISDTYDGRDEHLGGSWIVWHMLNLVLYLVLLGGCLSIGFWRGTKRLCRSPELLFDAIRQPDTCQLEMLLWMGFDSNRPRLMRWSPLMYAIRKNNLEAARVLVLRGADPSQIAGPLIRRTSPLELAKEESKTDFESLFSE